MKKSLVQLFGHTNVLPVDRRVMKKILKNNKVPYPSGATPSVLYAICAQRPETMADLNAHLAGAGRSLDLNPTNQIEYFKTAFAGKPFLDASIAFEKDDGSLNVLKFRKIQDGSVFIFVKSSDREATQTLLARLGDVAGAAKWTASWIEGRRQNASLILENLSKDQILTAVGIGAALVDHHYKLIGWE